MLTDTEVRAAKAVSKPTKLFDDKGLYLLVKPGGARLWRFKYRFPPRAAENKEKLLALGAYPDVSLKQAREKRDKARSDLADNIDPGLKRAAERYSTSNTFKAVALELFALLRKASADGDGSLPKKLEPEIPRGRKSRKRQAILEDTVDTMERRLELHIFPYIGGHNIGAVTGSDLLSALRRLASALMLPLISSGCLFQSKHSTWPPSSIPSKSVDCSELSTHTRGNP
jgi:hypothetical protein